jgi:hypothetical protein
MLLTAGCGGSGGSGDASSGASSQASAKPTYTPPKYTNFDGFPGKELKHFRGDQGLAPLGVRVKGIDSKWTPELLGKSADIGEHYLAVYVAVTPEEKDRGTQHVTLDGLLLRDNAKCPMDITNHNGKYCEWAASPYSELKSDVADGRWRTMYWTYNQLSFDDVAAGETRIGVAGFKIPDDDKGPFELCATGVPDDPNNRYSFSKKACVPIPQPKNAR